MESMRVALALGSGGARGYAHIGVIDELHERGHEVVGVAGSSMGALVGGLESAGKLDQFSSWASSLTQRAVLRLLDPSLTAPGVLRAEKILDAVREIVSDATIEEISLHALMRHQYHRRRKTTPVPAPIVSINFHAPSTDVILKEMMVPKNRIRIVERRETRV